MKQDSDHKELQAIRRALDQGTREIDASIVARLHQAREAGVDKRRIESNMELATVKGSHKHSQMPHLRVVVALIGLTLGVLAAYYWNTFEQIEENAEIDSALLADELPVDAYADQGFQAWLENTSHSQP